MNIEPWIERLEGFPAGETRQAFLEGLRAFEAEIFEFLAGSLLTRWGPGLGLASSHFLSAWRDAVIASLLRRLGGLPEGTAVVAVGGYGRGELSPFSDMDLLVLCRKTPSGETEAFLGDFFRLLWDSGYQLGSSTRTVKEVSLDAKEDPHFLTALFTARLVAGDEALFSELAPAVEKILKKTRGSYLEEKSVEIEAALRGLGSEVLVKEPNLKTNPGGLRSVHLLEWLNYAFHGERGLEGLALLFSAEEHAKLVEAYDFILFLRNLLHLRSGRKEDVLRLEHQAAAAAVFGLAGGKDRAMIELLRKYYDEAIGILRCLLAASDRFAAASGKNRNAAPAEKTFVLDGRLNVNPTLGPDPCRALELAAECCRKRLGPSGSLLVYLEKSSRLLDASAGDGRRVFLKFRDLLGLANSYEGLSILTISGFLGRCLPPFGEVRNLVVHNPFHSFTVDQHSLEAVKVLETLGSLAKAERDKYGLPVEVAAKYDGSLWVVKLALLLHDVGKAYEGDHAKNGAEMLRGFLKLLPTEELFKDMIVFLTENHLLLSNVARRGNIEDEGVVENLAREFVLCPFPEESLDFLYLLTCSDVASTNSRSYSGYTAGMLASLYLKALRIVTQGASAGRTGDVSSLVEVYAGRFAAEPEGRDLAAFVRALGERYCGLNSQAEVRSDFGDFRALAAGNYKLKVTLFNDHLKVKVLAEDRRGLFSLLCGLLLVNGADIVKATIHTYENVAIDEFVITGVHGNDMLEERMEKELSFWMEDLDKSFRRYLFDPEALDKIITGIERDLKDVHAAFRRETVVTVKRAAGAGFHIDLACTDRPALLYDVTHCLSLLGFDIRGAYVDTTGWYVRDGFEVESRGELFGEIAEALPERIKAAASGRGFTP